MNNKSFKTNIYCFICGIAFKQTHFVSHYQTCKDEYISGPNNKVKTFHEPTNFQQFLSDIQHGKDISLYLTEYHRIVEELNFQLVHKQCSHCKRKFYPSAYLKHTMKCFGKRSHTESSTQKGNVYLLLFQKQITFRRKTSMENLKSIARDEIKEFKNVFHFNDKLNINCNHNNIN